MVTLMWLSKLHVYSKSSIKNMYRMCKYVVYPPRNVVGWVIEFIIGNPLVYWAWHNNNFPWWTVYVHVTDMYIDGLTPHWHLSDLWPHTGTCEATHTTIHWLTRSRTANWGGGRETAYTSWNNQTILTLTIFFNATTMCNEYGQWLLSVTM